MSTDTTEIRPSTYDARYHINCWLEHDGLYGCIYNIDKIWIPARYAAKGVCIEWEKDTFYAHGVEDCGETVFMDIYANEYGKKFGGWFAPYRIANLSDNYRVSNNRMHY